MNNIKALIVGVSNYDELDENNLPFCRNDVIVMKDSLITGLKAEESNVITLGDKSDIVTFGEFNKSLIELKDNAKDDDILIFYFSGHGGTLRGSNEHFLALSDGCIGTDAIISYLDEINAKSKVIFLDSCQSGAFKLNDTSKFNIENTVADFANKGYAVFASSKSNQYSYPNTAGTISLFTSFLCDALKDKYIIRKGKVSLYDINRLVKLYLSGWNYNHPDMQQQPIFRANMGGTIYFDVDEYNPYCRQQIYEETKKYIIYNVEPVHNCLIKRYSVRIILKEPFSAEEVIDLSLEIVAKIKYVDVYSSKAAEERLKGKPANIIWMYFGRDERDIEQGTFIYSTTWADENQDRDYWYKKGTNAITVKDINCEIFSYYDELKRFNGEHEGSKSELVCEIKKCASILLTDAEKIISLFENYQNDDIDESEFIEHIKIISPEIERAYFCATELDFPPIELKEWFDACLSLFGVIHDFTLFYNDFSLKDRTKKNRIDCMNMTIKRYYSDLEKVKSLEHYIK